MKIVAVSDLHGNLPDLMYKYRRDTLLLIAGDICPDFVARAPQRAWVVDEFLPWIRSQGFDDYYATWGNHDWLPKPSREWANLEGGEFIKIDELVEYPYEDGILKIWFSPWSNQFGHWAWMDSPAALAEKYTKIPEDTDIIVSHQPPYGYGDTPDPRYTFNVIEHVGSKELLDTIGRVKPKAVVCGHIHGGYGIYQIGDTTVYNVSLVNEAYRPVNGVTEIDL